MKENLMVIEKILDECEKAVMRGKPIIVLRTKSIEIVRQVVESDRLVVRLSKDCSNGVHNEEVVPTYKLERRLGRRINYSFFDIHNSMYDFNILCFDMDPNKRKNFIKANEANTFPKLYIADAQLLSDPTYRIHDVKVWSNLDLRPFIDRFSMERFTGTTVGNSVFLIYGEDAVVPTEYENYCEIVDEPYPEKDEIINCLDDLECYNKHKDLVEETNIKSAIATALRGIRITEIKHLLLGFDQESCCGSNILFDEIKIKKEISNYKKQILKKNNVLELIQPEENISLDLLGGMDEYKNWLNAQKNSILDSGRLYEKTGMLPPKGVLICGVPGCGKSLAAECTANELKLPLLKMDIGQLMGKYVGESEHNMIKALAVAEATAPCVLFIDELDKGFDSVSRDNESGNIKRMFGTLLGWMQKCKEPCFIFATANDISKLPKEFFRSGRFDCLFSSFMPSHNECINIFKKQMECAKPGIFDKNCTGILPDIMKKLADEKRFVTGADIAKIVQMALRGIWEDGRSEYTGAKDITINKDLWHEKLISVIDQTTVFGEKKANLDSIALCYIRLLRGNFKSVSNSPMFREYEVSTKDKNTNDNSLMIKEYKVKTNDYKSNKDYDNALYDILKPLIEEHGVEIEQAELERAIK